MKRLSILFFLSVFFLHNSSSQILDFSVVNPLRSSKPQLPVPLLDGENYSMMLNGNKILKYNYKTGKIVDTILDLSKLKKCPIKSFDGYELSPEQSRVLVYTNVHPKGNHSFTADYYTYEPRQELFEALSDSGAQECPRFSPNGRYIAFARANNLYLRKLDFHTEIPITTDGKADEIINGMPDFSYSEEFEYKPLFVWSPDSKLLAFVKLDETRVPTYPFLKLATNEGESFATYPQLAKIKYPKAGETVARASVCVYDAFYKSIKTMKLSDTGVECYIPHIQWSNNPDQLFVFKLNRNQNQLDVMLTNPRSTLSNVLLHWDDPKFIDAKLFNSLRFTADNQSFFLLNEQDGYRHIYQYDMTGMVMKQWTKGKWEVTNFYGIDESKQMFYFQSNEASPLQKAVYSVDKSGKRTLLSSALGTHEALFNTNFKFWIDNYSNANTPNSYTLREVKPTTQRQWFDNDSLTSVVKALTRKEFLTITTSENVKLNAWVLKPAGLTPTQKCPLVILHGGMPSDQKVSDSWMPGIEYALAAKGIAVVCADVHGSDGYGAEFKKSVGLRLGELESEDLIQVAQFFSKQPFVNSDKVSLLGYGIEGLSAYKALINPIFKSGVMLSSLTDFRYYNSLFTDRYMHRLQETFRAFEKNSLLAANQPPMAPILFVYSHSDSKVHAQNTQQLAVRLSLLGKQFEMQEYPNWDILNEKSPMAAHLIDKISSFIMADK